MPRKSQKQIRGNHRRPPRPESWNVERGNCRYCGGPIIENGKPNRRKHWHQDCATRWRIMNNPTDAKRHVFIREKGFCQGENCNFSSPLMGDFDVDHIKPLFESYGDASFFEPENLQLLCKSCHRSKTNEDMERYYELQRINYGRETDE